VCKFFGATIQKDHTSPEMNRVALVMAIYHQNLRSVIFHDDFIHPANAVATSAIVKFLEWASQIADALSYIHGLKLIHKHLKLENILVSIFCTNNEWVCALVVRLRLC
jgi:serine/threonine protein kinase